MYRVLPRNIHKRDYLFYRSIPVGGWETFNINTWRRRETSGDDRRASVSKKTRPRRASTAPPRKESVHPTKADAKQTRKIIEDTQQLEQTRRHRRIAMIVLGTFIFLLAASVLVVVITLTHSSFLSPASDSQEQTELNCKSQSLKVWILTPNHKVIRRALPLEYKEKCLGNLYLPYSKFH